MSANPASPRGWLRPNLDLRGRVVRGMVAAVVIGVAAGMARSHPLPAAGMAAAGLFIAFEAARGWCVVRGCGLRTPL